MNKIFMQIGNHYSNIPQTTLASRPPSVSFQSRSLTAPMVSRVHNVKPGCSSCGKSKSGL